MKIQKAMLSDAKNILEFFAYYKNNIKIFRKVKKSNNAI